MEINRFEQVKAGADLRRFANENLEASKGNMYCCPACGSGSHGTASSDGALSVKGDSWKCFSCGIGGDIFDLAGIVYGIEDKNAQLEAVAEWAGIDLEGERSRKPRAAKATQGAKRTAPAKPAADYSSGRDKHRAYIESCRANVTDPAAVSYLEARGFSLEDAQAQGIGYDPHKRRIVIPWRGNDYYHIDRDITGKANHKYLKPETEEVGKQPFYNPDATNQPAYFIVEGLLDAIAVNLCGFEAVAVASNIMSEGNLEEFAKGIHGEGVAVILLDNDEHGMSENGANLEAKLKERGITCKPADVSFMGAYKDAAEWHASDPAGLRSFLAVEHADAVARAVELEEQAARAEYNAELGTLRVKDPLDVLMGLAEMRDFEEPVPTGIDPLDDVLEGGLRAGLIALGAVSSMGKTTLALQIADHIAASGRGVLFVTIEQSAREIVSKSVSRYMYRMFGEKLAATPTAITSKARRDEWGADRNTAFLEAGSAYEGEVCPRMRLYEGNEQPSVSDVRETALKMLEHDGQAPVIFIDYLQLLKPASDRDGDKERTDKNVMLLRQLARDLQTPVIVISSFNRNSYSEGATMDAWKESGAIEYGCDVLLVLQPKDLQKKVENVAATKQKRSVEAEIKKNKAALERPCELFVTKNRNGRTPNGGIPLTFKARFATYEVEQTQERKRNIPVL